MRFAIRKGAWSVYRRSVVRLALNQQRESDLVIRYADLIGRSVDCITEHSGCADPETVTAFGIFCTAVGVLNQALGVDVDPYLIISPEEGSHEDRD